MFVPESSVNRGIEFIPYPQELEAIAAWKRQQLSQLVTSYFQCSEASVKRDLADIKAMVEAGEILPEDCPIATGNRRNFWLPVEAVRFIWYYRQVIQYYGNREAAKQYIIRNGIPL